MNPHDPLRQGYPTLFYHMVPPSSVAIKHMEAIRVQCLALGEQIVTLCPPNRSRSLAMTALEDALMRAIQSLALSGELVDPRQPPQEDTPLGRDLDPDVPQEKNGE